MKYFRNNREKILPWVTDWTSPQDHIRNEKDVTKLNYNTWFFCHPTSYLLMYYGISFLTSIIWTIVSIIFIINKYLKIGTFTSIIAIVFLYQGIRKISDYELIKNTTFYDIWMRDII